MERRYDLDWLRVLLFGLLVLHHVAVGFVGFGEPIYRFVNDELAGPFLELLIYFSHTWRLPTLFLISGVGTYFATRQGWGAGLLGRRVARLIVPALFGTFVLNAAYGYAIARMTGEAPESYLTFWAAWVTAPKPHQVGHLWFLYNLTAYTLLCSPLYALRSRIETAAVPAPVLVAAMVAGATVVFVLAKPFASAIAGDGHQFPWYLWIFASGYVLGARHREVLECLARRAWWLVGAGLVTFAAEIVLLERALAVSPELGLAMAQGGWAAGGVVPAFDPAYTVFSVIGGVNSWMWALACFGLAARLLDRPGPVLRHLHEAVFPIYVLHFPVTIIGLAVIAQLRWPWQVELLLLALAVYGITGGLYLAARRTGPLIYLIGGRWPRRAGGEPPV